MLAENTDRKNMFSGRIKQSRPSAVTGFAVGLIFVGLGIFVVIPKFGAFGIVWTLMSAVIAASNGYGLFSRRGRTLVEVEGGEERAPRSVADRLAELDDARRSGLITDTEYQTQRDRIISSV